MENRSANRGKQGGFRVLYYLQTAERLYLLTIYSKTEREDITVTEIRALVEAVLADDAPDDRVSTHMLEEGHKDAQTKDKDE